MAEHNELRELNQRIKTNPTIREITIFAHVLEHHVRFEERELFNYLQEQMQQDLELINLTVHRDVNTPDYDWPDHFWE